MEARRQVNWPRLALLTPVVRATATPALPVCLQAEAVVGCALPKRQHFAYNVSTQRRKETAGLCSMFPIY